MKIQVPTDLNDITLAQYQKYMEANVEGAEEDFLIFKTIEIFCDVDMATVSQFPLEDAQDIAIEINQVLDQTKPLQRQFTVDGVEYGLIPDFEALTIGEYIDLENGLAEVKNFHKAASVLYRPVVKKFRDLYTIEPYTGYKVESRQFPMGAISAAIVFFYNIGNELLRVSPRYLGKVQEKTLTTLVKANSQKNTDGLTASTIFAEVGQQIIKEQLS